MCHKFGVRARKVRGKAYLCTLPGESYANPCLLCVVPSVPAEAAVWAIINLHSLVIDPLPEIISEGCDPLRALIIELQLLSLCSRRGKERVGFMVSDPR